MKKDKSEKKEENTLYNERQLRRVFNKVYLKNLRAREIKSLKKEKRNNYK